MAANSTHKQGFGSGVNLLDYPAGVSEKLFTPEIEAKLRMYKPNATRLLTLLSGGPGVSAIKTRSTKQFAFDHFAQFPLPEFVEASAAATSSATTIYVLDASGITKRMLLRNTRTGEIMHVTDVYGFPGTSITTAGQVTVARGMGDVGAAAIVAGDTLLIISTVGEEAQEAFTGISRDPFTGTLYVQEFGWGFSLSEWLELSSFLLYNEADRLSSQALDTYKEHQETAALFGQPRYLPTGGIDGKRLYLTAGLDYFCRTSGNITDANHMLTEQVLSAAMKQVTTYCTDREAFLAVCSTAVLNDISMLPSFVGKMQMTDTQDTWGFKLKKFEFSSGTVRFMAHRKLDVPGNEGLIYLANLADIEKVVFRGEKVRNIDQTNGRHVRQVELSSIWGLDCKNPFGQGMIVNAR